MRMKVARGVLIFKELIFLKKIFSKIFDQLNKRK